MSTNRPEFKFIDEQPNFEEVRDWARQMDSLWYQLETQCRALELDEITTLKVLLVVMTLEKNKLVQENIDRILCDFPKIFIPKEK